VTAPTLALTDVERIATDLAAQDVTTAQALATLRARGLTADQLALDDAVHALRERDGLLAGALDPLAVLEVQPRPGTDWRQVAVDRCEDRLGEALRTLARREVAS
jgi:hypothetical protein